MLVTGAAGYVGGRLVKVLQREGWSVRGVVREPARRLEVEQTVCDLAAGSGSAELLAQAIDGADLVIHLAGENEIFAEREPAAALSATVVASERVAEACAAARIRRLIYMSTIHVYGERMVPGAVLSEDLRAEPRSAYAISRLASEHLAHAFARGAYELVILRLTNSVGAPDHPSVDRWTLVSTDLCRQGALTGRLKLRTSGTQWRDFVPLETVCDAIAAAGESGSGLPPGTYNLGSGRPTTVRELARMIQSEFARQTGTLPELEAPDPEPEPPGPYRVSVERARQHGLRLDSPLEDAVEETVRFCLEHREELP